MIMFYLGVSGNTVTRAYALLYSIIKWWARKVMYADTFKIKRTVVRHLNSNSKCHALYNNNHHIIMIIVKPK